MRSIGKIVYVSEVLREPGNGLQCSDCLFRRTSDSLGMSRRCSHIRKILKQLRLQIRRRQTQQSQEHEKDGT